MSHAAFIGRIAAAATTLCLHAAAPALPPLPDDFINDEVVFLGAFDLVLATPGAVDATGRGVIEHLPEFGDVIARIRGDHEAFVKAGARCVVIAGADAATDDLYAFLPVAGVFLDAGNSDEAALSDIIRKHSAEIVGEPILERHGDWMLVYKSDRRRLTHRDEKDPLPEIPTVDPERAERFRTAWAALEGRSIGIVMIPTADMHREAREEFGQIGANQDSPAAIPYLLAGALAIHGWVDLGHNPSVTGVVELQDATLAAKLAGTIQSLPRLFEAEMSSRGEEEQAEPLEPEESLAAKALAAINCVQAGSKVTVSIGQAKLRPILDDLGPILAVQKQRAQDAMMASRSRQLAVSLIMYANDHDDQWPDTLDELVKAGYLTREQLDDYLTHPTTGEKIAFRYVKPDASWRDQPATTAVLYELRNGAIEPGGWVCYADGHAQKGQP